ncbi:MAG: hypothetical protein IJP82_04300 [Bacteroidaceae bacterium]|nr:hypothetical protein [Bacteroidaceae bacterium]
MHANFIKVLLRRLRLVKIDRNFLVFLVFLLVSIIFWFMQAIRETTEVSITYQLKIEDVPSRVIYTSEIPTEVSVNYTGRGWEAFYHKFMLNEDHELTIPFKDINRSSGRIVITADNFRRAALKKKPKELTYSSTTPSKIEAYYSNGLHKRVPVIFNGNVTTTGGRYQCGIRLTPDSVDVYAPDQIYDQITSVRTEKVTFEDLEDTLDCRLAIQVPHGAKIDPDSINTQICVDIFTDKTIEVPIYSENMPTSKIMRTFPPKVKATFLVSSTLYDDITEEGFIIVVDYKETNANAKRCKLHVRQKPEHIRHLRISPEYVEYVIEQETE